MALGPTVILRALTCLDKGPETGGFSRVLGVVGIISIFMYYRDSDQPMNGPTAAVVIFFLLMCVKRLLMSLTPLLRYDTHTQSKAKQSLQLPLLVTPPGFPGFLRATAGSFVPVPTNHLRQGQCSSGGASCTVTLVWAPEVPPVSLQW